jgi:hypothetical protein
MAYNGCGYKIVGDYGAQPYQPRRKLDARYTLGKPLQPLCFMSRCYMPLFIIQIINL